MSVARLDRAATANTPARKGKHHPGTGNFFTNLTGTIGIEEGAYLGKRK